MSLFDPRSYAGVRRHRHVYSYGLESMVTVNEGVTLYPSIMPALATWSDKLGVPAPAPMR